MKVIVLRVDGKPATKGRARVAKDGHVHSPRSNIINENDIRAIWREVGSPRIDGDVSISIDVLVEVTRPKDHFKSDGSLTAKGLRSPVPLKKPDVDNALKTIMDALNSRAYRDDVLVSRAVVERRWSSWPMTTIRISSWGLTENNGNSKSAA
jgi:Holliday junction resolvase RusA-like endonuclease